MLILNGKNMMPAFKDILNDADIAAAMTHERNSWGNTVKDVIQPSDVKAMRQKIDLIILKRYLLK